MADQEDERLESVVEYLEREEATPEAANLKQRPEIIHTGESDYVEDSP